MMVNAPIACLDKKKILFLLNNKCQHRHSYLEHYSCYTKEHQSSQKLGFFDIETSNLSANFGIILCYCIKPYGEKNIIERRITKNELNRNLDREVVQDCVKQLQKFDKIVTYYGKRYDIPFLRTRAIHHNIDFPVYGTLHHKDIYFIIRDRFRLHSNRLENACKTLLGVSNKTHLEPQYWIKALQGDRRSLDYITDHCRKDVIDLEKLYNKVLGFAPDTKSSI